MPSTALWVTYAIALIIETLPKRKGRSSTGFPSANKPCIPLRDLDQAIRYRASKLQNFYSANGVSTSYWLRGNEFSSPDWLRTLKEHLAGVSSVTRLQQRSVGDSELQAKGAPDLLMEQPALADALPELPVKDSSQAHGILLALHVCLAIARDGWEKSDAQLQLLQHVDGITISGRLQTAIPRCPQASIHPKRQDLRVGLPVGSRTVLVNPLVSRISANHPTADGCPLECRSRNLRSWPL